MIGRNVNVPEWFELLKMLLPRQFMENIQNDYGGSFKGGVNKKGEPNFELTSDWGRVTLKQGYGGKLHVVIVLSDSRNISISGYNLNKMLTEANAFLNRELKNEDALKGAGAVVSTTPGIHNLRYSVRDKDGKEETDD